MKLKNIESIIDRTLNNNLSLTILLILCSKADHKYRAYCSQKYIQNRTRSSRSTVHRAIKHLIDEKLITPSRTTSTNIYFIDESIVECSNNQYLSFIEDELNIPEREDLIPNKLEPAYVKFYINNVEKLKNLNSTSTRVMQSLLKYMDYNGELQLTVDRREKIAKEAGVNERSVRNQLVELTNNNILKNKRRMTYVFNPNLFVKGDCKNIEKLREIYSRISPPKANPQGVKRTNIRPKTRFKVLNRDNFKCVYCGVSSSEAKLHVDHKMPLAKGGKDVFENYVTACEKCNLGKGVMCINAQF